MFLGLTAPTGEARTSRAASDLEEFEVEIPSRFVGPIPLSDGSLLATDSSFERLISSDGGRTWESTGPLLTTKGKPIESNTRPWSLLRLASGAIALTYETIPPSQGGRIGPEFGTFFRKSMDEGRTWSSPVRVSWANTPANPTWLIQTGTGRLVLPNEYWFTQPGDRGLGICSVYYSEDEGGTWTESLNSLFVCEEEGAAVGSAEVPCVAETSNGRLLLFMRTRFKRIAQSWSDSDGTNWTPVSLNEIVSSNSEIWLAQIPPTEDLLCVWNQASAEEIRTGFYRSRLSSAVSKDNGKTWGHFRTLTASDGMEKVDRIADPEPPGFLETGSAIPPKGTIPPGYRMVRAPRVKFVGETAYLVYLERRYDRDGTRTYQSWKLRALPVSWFYENGE